MFLQIQNLFTNHSIIARGKRVMNVHTGKTWISPYNLPWRALAGSRSVAILTLQLYAKWGWWIRPWLGRFTPRKMDSEPIVLEAGWAAEYAWMNVEKRQLLAPVAARTPKRPMHSESLYRLRYPGPIQLQQKKDSATPACKTKGHHWEGYWHCSRTRCTRNSPLLKSQNTVCHSFQ